MLFWEKAQMCDLDKDVIAHSIEAYAVKLEKQDRVPSAVDGIDQNDKPIILRELENAAEDISAGKVLVAKLSMSQAWMGTSNELLIQRKPNGDMKYTRAITVAQHIHQALTT